MVLFACELIPAMGAPAASEDLLHKTSEKAADANTTAANFQLFCIILVADSAMQHHPCGGFPHAATKIAAGAPIAGIRLQTKRTTAKLEHLKFTNENKFFQKNKSALYRVEMCEQCNEIIKRA
jgi:hypothetical protein